MAKDIETGENPRKEWMSLLAKAPEAELMALWAKHPEHPSYDWLRAPEVGGVMVRGRTGGSGAPFNLGEMTVTRCSLALADGTVGHGYVQGRSKSKAEAAALIDALMQTEGAAALAKTVLEPLREKMQQAKTDRAAKAAATKVDFFTMVRGED